MTHAHSLSAIVLVISSALAAVIHFDGAASLDSYTYLNPNSGQDVKKAVNFVLAAIRNLPDYHDVKLVSIGRKRLVAIGSAVVVM